MSTSENEIPYVTLNNGVRMPQLGFGVYQIDPAECERCVLDAVAAGYRMIDTAQAYHNEEAVGAAVRKCGLPREQLFVVTKVWVSNAGEERAYASILESLRRLDMDHVDLLLVHEPFGDYYGTYRAMERAYREGKARAIGVSNFYPDRLVDLQAHVEVKPAVDQVETNVFNQQTEAQRWMEKYGCRIMAWAPFAEGAGGLFANPVLREVGAAHGKTAAQVALRFLLQRGVIAIPKSTHRERMAENLAVFDFELGPAEMERVAGLDLGHSIFFSHQDPAMVEQFLVWEKTL